MRYYICILKKTGFPRPQERGERVILDCIRVAAERDTYTHTYMYIHTRRVEGIRDFEGVKLHPQAHHEVGWVVRQQRSTSLNGGDMIYSSLNSDT